MQILNVVLKVVKYDLVILQIMDESSRHTLAHGWCTRQYKEMQKNSHPYKFPTEQNMAFGARVLCQLVYCHDTSESMTQWGSDGFNKSFYST